VNEIASIIAQLERQKTAIDRAITALRDVSSPQAAVRAAATKGPGKKRRLSPEGRRRIAEAARKRWAAEKAAKAAAATKTAKPAKKAARRKAAPTKAAPAA
jgi:hypothetical protein